MPAIPIHISLPTSGQFSTSPLPTLLQTPSGMAILEIQGTIHAPFPPITTDDNQNGPNSNDESQRQTQIGNLEFPLYEVIPDQDLVEDKWMKKVYLYIGKYQRLTGEVKKLAKPLGIVRKVEATEGRTEALEIVEVVKYKLLFAGRPEPVGGE